MHISFENYSALWDEFNREKPTEQNTYWGLKLDFGNFPQQIKVNILSGNSVL